MVNPDITQELNDLGSILANAPRGNNYSVPDGYFEGLAMQVLGRIESGSLDADDATGLNISKAMPYEVPANYFDGLADAIMRAIHQTAMDSQTEIASISPLLSNINKQPVYSVPDGYFETLTIPVERKQSEVKVVSMASRKWFRYAAAAVVTAVIAVAAFISFGNKSANSGGKGLASFEKEVKKIQDIKQTESLIDYMNSGLNEKDMAKADKNTQAADDVQRLLKDVSEDELKAFSQQSMDIENVMMTN
jgi:hypothetical protein